MELRWLNEVRGWRSGKEEGYGERKPTVKTFEKAA